MTYNYTFRNQASIGNIPKELKKILEDTIALYTSIVPKQEIVCIFAQGSVTRGNFKSGVSDFDTTAIANRELTEEEQDAFNELRDSLESKYRKIGVEKIDGSFVDLRRFLIGERPKLHFIFGTDGVCVYGAAPAIKRVWPDPGNELSKMLNSGFPKSIEQYRKHLKGVNSARAGLNAEQWIAKQAVRLLFAITMEQSQAYTAKLENYRDYIKAYLGKELTRFDCLYAAYLGERIQGDELLAHCKWVLKLARKYGAI
jgi:hypothetical protein